MRDKLEFETNRYTLLCIKQINNKRPKVITYIENNENYTYVCVNLYIYI